MTKQTLYDKADKRIHKWAGTVGAIMTILAAAAGVCAWVSNQFSAAVSSQISEFQQETRDANTRHEQAVTRVELMILMEHDPENIVAIEKMARYYFRTLDGDLYMTQRYSDWAKQYGGDTTIVIGGAG